jgi:hypothetical protein
LEQGCYSRELRLSEPNTCPEGGCQDFFTVFLASCARVWIRGTTAVEHMERGDRIRGGTLLPTPEEETDPPAGQSAHGGLMRCPFVTLLLGIAPRPESMPDRCGGPLDDRVPEALWTLEAPGLSGRLAAACGDRCEPGLLLPGGGAIAGAWFATGDEQPGGEDGPCAWERLAQGAVGRALRTLREGILQGRNRRHGDPELVDKGLDEHGMGSDNALIGRQGEGGLDRLEALCDDVR